ncbi:MAG TPA: hypothetical protein DCM32_01605 [Xanthomonadaceae bacterium]|jgi:hypothetical protein|nr:hypothetical protein [Xanthomonadaceae bacterium]
MTLNKKILAAAIVGGLFAANAQAQVNLAANPAAPVTFASELAVPTAGLTLTNVSNALDLTTPLGYSFSEGEVRFVRIECASNIRFATGSGVTTNSGALVGAINGLGTNAITFSITGAAGNPSPTNGATTITVGGNRTITSTAGGDCTYGLYDQPSQAQAGGTAGRIATRTGAYIQFRTSFTLTATPVGAVANVEATPSFSRFLSAAPTNSVGTGSLGVVTFALRTPAPLIANGTAVTLATVLGAASNHTIAGDFANAANADGTFTGTALTRVFFAPNADCTGTPINASVVTATSARFDTGATAVPGLSLCYAPRSGVAIPVSTYAQTFNAVSADPANYSVASLGPVALGSITRNGTSLQAPLVQVPTGWLSRVVLTNTGSVARPYTISAQTEAGTTAVAGTAATGTVPANGTLVLSTTDIATFTGQPRGTLNVTVAGPTNDIQGLYQIVNPASGSISNHVMVRPGSN